MSTPLAGAWLCGTLATPPLPPLRGHPAPPALGLATCVDPAEAAARYDGVGTYDSRRQTAHFEIDYDSSSEIVSASYLDVLATALEDAWTEEVDVLGWPAPQGSDAYAVQVILTNLPSDQPLGGVAMTADCEGAPVGYFLLNTDFWYRNVDYLYDVPAHEFNHLLQVASGADYSGRKSAFFYESTAVWVEDLVHEDTNTYAIDFLPGWLEDPGTTLTSYTYATGLQYAHFVWDLYLDEGVGGPELVRDLWTDSEEGVSAVDRAVEATGQPLPELWAGFLARMAAFDVSDHDVFQDALDSGSVAFYAVDADLPASGDSPASPEALGATFLHLVGPAGQGLRFTLSGEDADAWVAGGEDSAGPVTAVAEDGELSLSFSGYEAWIGVGPTARDAGDWTWSAEAVADTGAPDEDSGDPPAMDKSQGCGCQSAGGAWAGPVSGPLALLLLGLRRARRAAGSGRLRVEVTMRRLPALILLAGCAGDKADTGSGDAPTWYRDVEPIVTARCAPCHYDGGIAPFALDSYEAASARSGAMASATSLGIMPPYPPDDSCNSYRYDRSLSEEQIQTLADWAAADAPEGDAANPGAPLDVEVEALSRVDVELELADSYTASDYPDEYRCFPFDWPEGETYVTGFGVTPGEARVVHHVIAYTISGDDAAAVQGWDDDDPGPGYACYGGPNPSRGSGDRVNSDWIGGWVPGSSGTDLPEGLGISIEAGSIVVVQIHYNMETAGALPDQTSVQFKIDDSVDHPATVAKLLDPTWVLDEDAMLIPAGEEATYSYDFSLPTDVTLYRVGLHMHQIGQSASLKRLQDDGSETCLLDIPDWDFHWQGTYELEDPVSLDRGDTVRLSCTFDNTGSEDVAWGEGSSDEMCLGLATVTVR